MVWNLSARPDGYHARRHISHRSRVLNGTSTHLHLRMLRPLTIAYAADRVLESLRLLSDFWVRLESVHSCIDSHAGLHLPQGPFVI